VSLIDYFRGLPMAIDPQRWYAEAASLDSRLAAVRQSDPMPALAGAGTPRGEGIVVIPVAGVLLHASSPLTRFMGWTSVDDISQALDAALEVRQAKAIVLDIDSPGGSVFAVPELAEKIYKARGKKPIYAVVNPMACSAAYWIASAAGKLICTPSGEVGSVGVYTVHQDLSRAAEQAGVKHTLVRAGSKKGETLPVIPLSDDAKAHLQQRADGIHDDFVEAVAKHRGVTPDKVRKTYGEGRSMRSKEALRAGLIDRIATFEQVVGELTRPGQPTKSSTQSLRAKYGDLLN
jgi:capsid assembly protease